MSHREKLIVEEELLEKKLVKSHVTWPLFKKVTMLWCLDFPWDCWCWGLWSGLLGPPPPPPYSLQQPPPSLALSKDDFHMLRWLIIWAVVMVRIVLHASMIYNLGNLYRAGFYKQRRTKQTTSDLRINGYNYMEIS